MWKQIFVFIFSVTVTHLSFAGTTFVPLEQVVLIEKQIDEQEQVRYSFSYCDSEGECSRLGHRPVSFKEVKKLSGNMQRWVGAPSLFISEGVAAAGVVLLLGPSIGAVVAPAATSGTVATTIGAAGVAVPTATSTLIGDSQFFRALSPRYHWKKGTTKVTIERAVKSLNKTDVTLYVLYKLSDFDGDLEDFESHVTIVDRILNSY